MVRKISVLEDVYLIIAKNKRNHTTSDYLRSVLKKDVKKTEEITKLKVELEKSKEELQLYKPTSNPKKEEWKKRVEAEGNLPLMLSDFEVPCHYRTVTSKGEMYCDDKKTPKEVCIQRQKRHLTMKRMCMPSALKKQRKGKATFSPNLWQPKSGVKGDTKLWRG